MADPIFTDGFIFKTNPNAPDFVKMKISIKEKEAIDFIKKHANGGWLNLDVKESKSGKIYGEVDTWKPQKKEQTTTEVDEDLPF